MKKSHLLSKRVGLEPYKKQIKKASYIVSNLIFLNVCGGRNVAYYGFTEQNVSFSLFTEQNVP